MEIPKNIGFTTKYLSNRNYLKELSVDGKRTGRFYFYIGFYDKYVSQIIRNGNCISLLTHEIGITSDNFWNTNYFEDLSRFVFWTFNKSFLLTITEKIDLLKISVLKRCRELLAENPAPYGQQLQIDADEELQWCILKNHNLTKSGQFEKMYALDRQNRLAILSALDNKIASLSPALSPTQENPLSTAQEIQANNTPIFLEMLRPMNGGAEETLQFIKSKLSEADFEFNLFESIPKLANGKNPYGLNGCIAAMIEFFYQHNYFKPEHTLEEIFKAYQFYSGNRIGKLKVFISEFRNDNNFRKYSARLKELKISRLS